MCVCMNVCVCLGSDVIRQTDGPETRLIFKIINERAT